MSILRQLTHGLRALINRDAADKDVADEVQQYLDDATAELMASGLTAEDARRAAQRGLGSMAVVREQMSSYGWENAVRTIVSDVRYALRKLRQSPGFTVVAVASLALGIGVDTACFTLIHAVLLQRLPVSNPKALVRIGDNNDCCVNGGRDDRSDYSLFSYDTYQSFLKNTSEFEDVTAFQAGFRDEPIMVRQGENNAAAHAASGEFVAGNYFQTFGLSAESGRLIAPSDDMNGVPATAVMSYEAWRRDYAGDPSVVGDTFWLNTHPVVVIGIAPKGFYGDRLSSTTPDFYIPIHAMPKVLEASYVFDPHQRWLYVIGRVKPGVALGPLQEKLNRLLRNALSTDADSMTDIGRKLLPKAHVTLVPAGAGIQELQKQYESSLKLLVIISGLVLLIACANLANLLLVRGMARKVEISVRAALGATRGRILRQLLTESIVLAVMGGLVGLQVSYLGTRMLLALAFPASHSIPIHAEPSPVVLAFACGLSLITGIIFGAVPAWLNSHAQPVAPLRASARSKRASDSFLQQSLVIIQAALSLVLLIAAGLLSRSLYKLEHQNFNLATANRYIVHIDPKTAGYPRTQLEVLYRSIKDHFHEIVGVKNVGISTYTPLEGSNEDSALQIQGQPFSASQPKASFVKTNTEYFDAIGTKVLTGRGFKAEDASATPGVAVVNEAFVNKFLNGAKPLGKHFGVPGAEITEDWEIVGVVEDTNYQGPLSDVNPMYFLPILQGAAYSQPAGKDDLSYASAIVIATRFPIDHMETKVRNALASINPNLTMVKFETFDQQIQRQFSQERMIARLTMLYGGLALLLAAVGLYGVMGYTVARRTAEIGIRIALGADRFDVLGMVLGGAVFQTGIGLFIGLPAALLAMRYIHAQLYKVSDADPVVLAASVSALLVAAAIAAFIPARRATTIDPVEALKME